MIGFLLEFINTLIYFMCVKSIGELFLGYKLRKSKYETHVMIFVGIIISLILLYCNIWVSGIGHVASVLIVSAICFQENWRKHMGLYIGSMSMLSMLSMLFEVIVAEILFFCEIKDNYNTVQTGCVFIMLLCIRGIGKYYTEKYETALKSVDIKYWMFYMLVLFFDSAVIVLLGDFTLNKLQPEHEFGPRFFYCCIVIGLLVQLVLLFNTLVTRNVHKENEKLAKQFLESQKEHYQYLEKREYETKKFRHDFKNHLMLLENLIDNEKYDESKRYLSTINEKVFSFSNQISVNNGIADAILNRFDMEAKEKGIMLSVKGHFPMACHISAYDICTILSNLLSNAIQAEIKTDGKEILVNIRYTEDKVLLSVENDYAHELDVVNDVYITTKEDSFSHGYGLKNVKECVEKNGGTLAFSTENHRFKVMIMMLNENEEIV